MLLISAGFLLSLLGSLPPGLISLTVSHTAYSRGLAAAAAVILGAAFAEFFQAVFAASMTDWFLFHPQASKIFRVLASPVFLFMALYMFLWAKPPSQTTRIPNFTGPKQFVKGLFVSAFNLLAIPYWFVYCGWLKVEGWWPDGLKSTLLFSFGVSLGTIAALVLYAWLGLLWIKYFAQWSNYANKLIGLVFLALGLQLAYQLYLQSVP